MMKIFFYWQLVFLDNYQKNLFFNSIFLKEVNKIETSLNETPLRNQNQQSLDIQSNETQKNTKEIEIKKALFNESENQICDEDIFLLKVRKLSLFFCL